MKDSVKVLIILGIGLIVLAIIIQIFPTQWIGRLPGDLRIEKENYKIYIPITTSLLISAILSLLFFIISKIRF